MTQQKTIQAIGRVGRNHIQQEYTVRFRDDEVLKQLFKKAVNNREAETMNRLFCSCEE
jgi:predicted urease superfamily metal-dependent hydrolase